MEPLYCYVDETGQDTFGKFFLVSVVVTGSARESIRRTLRAIEKETGKRTKKWTKSTLRQKVAYIERVLDDKLFSEGIFYAEYAGTTDYPTLVMKTLARVLNSLDPHSRKIVVFIDGIGRTERRRVAVTLRRQGIRTKKVRGLHHESDEFIRVADAVAGFVRDYLSGFTSGRSSTASSGPYKKTPVARGHDLVLVARTPTQKGSFRSPFATSIHLGGQIVKS